MLFPLVYEVNLRCWLRELSSAAGKPVTLADVPESAFRSWQPLGFTHIWLMGVWPTGSRARSLSLQDAGLRAAGAKLLPDFSDSDIAGSPYAIADYQPAASLGGDPGLKTFRSRLREFGLGLILDFVPNHVGLDHPWVSERPEWLVGCPSPVEGFFREMTRAGPRWLAHGRDPYFPPWTDTAQIDYRNPAARQAMIAELKNVAAHCDGVRCDMAMLVLNDVFAQTWRRFPSTHPRPVTEFWAEAIAAVRADHPDFLFVAEVYWDLQEPLQGLGFDFTYYKELYDTVVRREPEGLHRRLLQVSLPFLRQCAHFLENHDEPRIASLLSADEQKAATVLMLGLPGLRFLHEGQLAGARRHVPVHLTRRPSQDRDAGAIAFHEDLLRTVKETAVGRGECEVLRVHVAQNEHRSPAGCAAIQWHGQTGQFDLVLVNLLAEPVHLKVMPKLESAAGGRWRAKDLWAGGSTNYGALDLRHGWSLELPGHAAKITRFERLED